jgi:elongation factor P
MLSANELKNGTFFQEDGQPFQVVKYTHVKTARAGATIKVKAKNLLSGKVLEKSYLATNSVEEADISRKNAQYLYKDTGYVFMDPDTYAQFTISEEATADSARFLIAGQSAQILFFDDTPISIDLPKTMIVKIAQSSPGVKGNSATNVFKDAELENGTKIKVPLFISTGDMIKINTESGEYVSKA